MSDLVVLSTTQKLIMNPSTGSISVTNAGPMGPTGLTGPHGKSLLSGVVPPVSGDGVDDDFYINTATNMLYGPKTAGAWPSGVSLLSTSGVPVILNVPGALFVATGTARYYFTATRTISNILISCGSAPTGASVIVDVNKNGTTIFTTQGNRPAIAASGFVDLSSVPDVTSVTSGDYLTVDVDQVGSTLPGSDLTVQVFYS